MLDTANIFDSEDTDSAHLLKIKPRSEWLKPIPEEDRPETPEPDWIGKKKLSKSDLEGPTYKVAKAFHKNRISLQFQMEECHQILTDQVDLVNPEGHRLVLDVSKPLPLGGPPSQLKAAQYLDFGLEELVLSLWIESEREYDISAAYVHLFNAVNLWIRNIIIRKRVEDLQLRVESYQTKLNLTQPDWDASDFLFKEDYTIVSKPRVVIYRDRNDQKKMMQETKVHKFSNGTLKRILDKLDHMVKDFKLYEYNKGMET
ncbi:hypothetical protein Tco_0765288 [Tanacetum coccineum]